MLNTAARTVLTTAPARNARIWQAADKDYVEGDQTPTSHDAVGSLGHRGGHPVDEDGKDKSAVYIIYTS